MFVDSHYLMSQEDSEYDTWFDDLVNFEPCENAQSLDVAPPDSPPAIEVKPVLPPIKRKRVRKNLRETLSKKLDKALAMLSIVAETINEVVEELDNLPKKRKLN